MTVEPAPVPAGIHLVEGTPFDEKVKQAMVLAARLVEHQTTLKTFPPDVLREAALLQGVVCLETNPSSETYTDQTAVRDFLQRELPDATRADVIIETHNRATA